MNIAQQYSFAGILNVCLIYPYQGSLLSAAPVVSDRKVFVPEEVGGMADLCEYSYLHANEAIP